MEAGLGPRITIYVEYERKRLRIGTSVRLKTEFYSLHEFIDEIRLTFRGVIPYSVPLSLWRKDPDSTLIGLTDDRDLKETIKRARKSELILYAEKRDDVRQLQLERRVDDLEREGEASRGEIEKLKDRVAVLERQLEIVYVNRARGAKIEETPPAAGPPDFLGHDSVTIKSESLEPLD